VNPYWIKTEGVRLAIIPRPRGQDWLPDDISLLQRAGIDVVVSALTASENEELGLVEESRCCQSRAIEFLSFPIEDRSVPNSFAEFTELVNSVTPEFQAASGSVRPFWPNGFRHRWDKIGIKETCIRCL
jgi:hypothetical protein